MNKKQLIAAIILFDAQLIWEIDDSKYYQMIGTGDGGTYWFKPNLEEMKNKFLKELLVELEQCEPLPEPEMKQANHKSPFGPSC